MRIYVVTVLRRGINDEYVDGDPGDEDCLSYGSKAKANSVYVAQSKKLQRDIYDRWMEHAERWNGFGQSSLGGRVTLEAVDLPKLSPKKLAMKLIRNPKLGERTLYREFKPRIDWPAPARRFHDPDDFSGGELRMWND